MTKKEAKARKEAWQRALNEHRVVSINHGEQFREYTTAEHASRAVTEALKAGMPAKVV